MRSPTFRILTPIVAAAAIATLSSAATLPTVSESTITPNPVDQGQLSAPIRTVYVPGALAGSDPQIWTVVWAHNNGSSDATVRLLTAWDPAGEHDLTLNDPITIAAGDAAYLYAHTHPSPREGVQFLALSLAPGITIRPLLQRTQGEDSAGALTLPTFTDLLPAGTTTIAGNFRSSHAECAPSGVPRRLNVTLFNAGDAPATFHVVVQTRDNGIDTGPSYPGRPTEADYLVPGRSVRQINGVPYDVDVLCGGRGWEMGWVEITADQPYLAYASTVRQDAPGILPYEVFPALTGH